MDCYTAALDDLGRGCCPALITLPKRRQIEGFKMSVITVSRQLYSQGVQIAQAVANRFDSQFVDKEKIGSALVIAACRKLKSKSLMKKAVAPGLLDNRWSR